MISGNGSAPGDDAPTTSTHPLGRSRALQRALLDAGIHPKLRVTIIYVASHCNDDGHAYVSLRTVARDLGLKSPNSVKYALQIAEIAGLWEKAPHPTDRRRFIRRFPLMIHPKSRDETPRSRDAYIARPSEKSRENENGSRDSFGSRGSRENLDRAPSRDGFKSLEEGPDDSRDEYLNRERLIAEVQELRRSFKAGSDE